MIATDEFLDRVPRSGYNCLDFVREVWLAATGTDIAGAFPRLTGPFKDRRACLSGRKKFKRLLEPSKLCLVFMQRPFTKPHIGVWIDGRVLHLKESGVEFQPLAIACGYYKIISFYQ